ncbi:hypothetical protein PBY51_016385 [Eleginops maclovinus]|uniref:Uncharacterized protein n=1 Tax=Eleginops maclovinus TaxID=56733 RepID=A0AAN8AQT8_ELEMC|nr:hypothetical protein PBY51_016385 [Eleginops maclovinus]
MDLFEFDFFRDWELEQPWPRFAKAAPLDDTSHWHHQQLGGCEKKLRLIPNCQELTNKPSKTNSEITPKGTLSI